MMENKEGLVAVVVRLLGGLFGGLGRSKKAPAPARSTEGAALTVNADPVPTNDEGGCPDPAHCPAPGMTAVPAAT